MSCSTLAARDERVAYREIPGRAVRPGEAAVGAVLLGIVALMIALM